jgi:hypothetical protein
LENEGECEQNKNNGIWIWKTTLFIISIIIFPPSASILSVPFLGDALIKLYETL